LGSMLGMAIGDSIGAPVEFLVCHFHVILSILFLLFY
jgi:hypothetical protein